MSTATPPSTDPPIITCDFPGGNILIDAVEGDTFHLRPDLRTTSEWWFYWLFRIRHAAGRTLRFRFTGPDPFTAMGPCASIDNGDTWRWLGRACVESAGDKEYGFTFDFADGVDEAIFSIGVPYVESNLLKFLAGRPAIRRESLTTTEGGRQALKLSLASRHGAHAVALSARTHACEAMANFALEGILDFWLLDPSPAGRFLRERVDFLVFPFVDWDGVEAGDQGKFRRPHDHNRDYADGVPPLYATTRAIQTALANETHRLAMGIDLHCPWIRGARNEDAYLVGQPEPWDARQRAFNDILDRTATAAVRCHGANFLPFGINWNTTFGLQLASHISRSFPQAMFGTTLEVPYAISGGAIMSPQAARDLGYDLGQAISLYVQQEKRS